MQGIALENKTYCLATDQNASLIKSDNPVNYTAVTSPQIFYEKYLMEEIEDVSNGLGHINVTLTVYLFFVYVAIFLLLVLDITLGKFSLGINFTGPPWPSPVPTALTFYLLKACQFKNRAVPLICDS